MGISESLVEYIYKEATFIKDHGTSYIGRKKWGSSTVKKKLWKVNLVQVQ
jgi:hypothetical protein